MPSISVITLVRIRLTASTALELPKPKDETLLQAGALQITDSQCNPFSICNSIRHYFLQQALGILSRLQLLKLREPKS